MSCRKCGRGIDERKRKRKRNKRSERCVKERSEIESQGGHQRDELAVICSRMEQSAEQEKGDEIETNFVSKDFLVSLEFSPRLVAKRPQVAHKGLSNLLDRRESVRGSSGPRFDA